MNKSVHQSKSQVLAFKHNQFLCSFHRFLLWQPKLLQFTSLASFLLCHSCILRFKHIYPFSFDKPFTSSPLAGFPSSSEGKASPCNAGDLSAILGSRRSPGNWNGNPLQYSCLENFMDRGTWQAAVHGITKSQWLILLFWIIVLVVFQLYLVPSFFLLLSIWF